MLARAHSTSPRHMGPAKKPAFTAMTRAGMEGVVTNSDGLAYTQRELIGDLALKNRLPAVVFMRETYMRFWREEQRQAMRPASR